MPQISSRERWNELNENWKAVVGQIPAVSVQVWSSLFVILQTALQKRLTIVDFKFHHPTALLAAIQSQQVVFLWSNAPEFRTGILLVCKFLLFIF